jgi:ABC-2 type transport system ATP-binding protein
VLAIQTEGLTKLYGAHTGIEDLTIEVHQGEIFGFLGPNGAGKTTTIRTLLDLLHPTRGWARIFDLDTRRDAVAIRAKVGNLPGDFGFGKTTTGQEAISLLAKLRHCSTKRAQALATRFGADLGRPLGHLSRGNRQKVGLVLATFHEPDLLILDEPTSGLDPLMQEEFLALLREERGRGCTVFLSSHELDEVERVCDRVGIVRDAKLAAVETLGQLLGKTSHRVVVTFAQPLPLETLASWPGVAEVAGDGATTSFHVVGPLDPVLKEMAKHTIADLAVAKPTLEEVFLSYYQGDSP